MQSPIIQNPYSPMAYNDLGPQQPGVFDRDFAYVYNVDMTASQALTQQVIGIDTDADFILRSVTARCLGPFAFRIIDSTGAYLMDNYIGSFVFNGLSGLSSPWIIWPDMFFPAGSQLKLDITDQSGFVANPIQMLFRGAKRYASR